LENAVTIGILRAAIILFIVSSFFQLRRNSGMGVAFVPFLTKKEIPVYEKK
jgi:hypothetical protein